MVQRFPLIAVLSLIACLLSGCGTIIALIEKERGPRVFMGTGMHLEAMSDSGYWVPKGMPPILFWAPIDLLLSLAADIALLPYTGPAQWISGNLELKHPKVHFLIACANNDMALAQQLIQQRPKMVNERYGQDSDKPPFLAVVAATGQPEFVGLLLEHGARVDVKDHEGQTPLQYAVRPTFVSLSPPLYAAEEEALKKRARYADVARLLVTKGAKLTVRSKSGETLLHAATESGHLDVVRYLLEQGADVNAHGSRGGTSLHTAMYWGRLEVARFLIEHGADVNARDRDGKTPLGVVRRLMELGQRDARKAKLVDLLVAHGGKE